jgi:adenylate cyclase
VLEPTGDDPQHIIADLQRQFAESEAQKTAMAEVLGIINSSPGNLTPVFDAILERALRLGDAAFGVLFMRNGKQFYCAAERNLPATLHDFLQEPFEPSPSGFFLRAANGHPVEHVVDVSADPVRLKDPRARAFVELGGCRTLLSVALRRDNEVLGAFGVYRREVRPFNDQQIALLQNFATQAVIAVENARLITETRDALEQQTATAEVLGLINSSSGDLAPVFDAMLDRALRLCDAAFGTLWTYDGELVHPVAVRGVTAAHTEFIKKQGAQLPGPANLRIIRGERVVQIMDMRESEGYRSGVPIARSLVDNGGRTSLVLGLYKDDRCVGILNFSRTEVRPFTDKQIALLQSFAAQAVIAMENARLLGELRQRTDEVAELNRGLEARVAEQVEELGRVGRLKRFLAPQLAELIVSQGDEKILESHRREIVVVFCDLRGYTAFTETAEPEEVLDFLREYHGALGPLVSQFEGTLDQFSGDGIMVFFNDPMPIPDAPERAVRMAVTMREAASALIAHWRRRDRALGFGVGIAQGYATLGQIGFAERSGYTAIGTVCNLAARLCAEAKDGQILISGRVAAAVENAVPVEDLGSVELKGLSQPVSAFNVPHAAGQPALRVIEGGPESV